MIYIYICRKIFFFFIRIFFTRLFSTKILFIRIFFYLNFFKNFLIRIVFIWIFFIRIRRNFYIVNNISSGIFFPLRIYLNSSKNTRGQEFVPVLKAESIKITEKQTNWGHFFGLLLSWKFVLIFLLQDFLLPFHYNLVQYQILFWGCF